jgi:hypothetical protein
VVHWFQSHVSYGLVVWGCSLHIHNILIIQKRVVHIFEGVGKLDHCWPIFKDRKILSVICLYIFHRLLYIKVNLDLVDVRGAVHTYGT